MKKVALILLGVVLMGCTINIPIRIDRVIEPGILLTAEEHAQKNPHFLFIRGKQSLEQNRAGEAKRFFLRAIKAKPDYVEAYLGLGHSYRRLKNFTRAKKAYEKVLRLEAENKQARLGLAGVYLELGDFTGVRQSLEPLLEKEPLNYDAQRLVAYSYYLEGKYKEGIEKIREALQQAPKEEDTLLRLIYDDLRQYLEKYSP